MKINIYNVILILLVIFLGVRGEECHIPVKDADECAKQLTFFGNPDVIIPLNDQDLDRECKIMFDANKCLLEFAQTCLPAFPHQAVRIFAYNIRKVLFRYCKRPEKRKEFLFYAKCWSPKEKMHRIYTCTDKFITQLEYISQKVLPELQIQGICCTFHQRSDCIEKELSHICDENNVEYVMNIIEDATRELTQWGCSKYLTTEACDQHYDPSAWRALNEIINVTDEELLATRHKHKSVLAPILSIITQFEM